MLRGYRLAGLLVAVTLAGAVERLRAVSAGPQSPVPPGVSCTNYAIHGQRPVSR